MANRTITGRTSSLASAFVQAIVPRSTDTKGPNIGLELCGIRFDECAYCGAPGYELDHFYALVKNKRPSGYFHTARNLIPSCGTCNHSKGGHDWQQWMLGKARNSPTSRKISDVAGRAARLRKFEEWGQQKPVSEDDLRAAVGAKRWDAYWERLEEIKRIMRAAQAEAQSIQVILEGRFGDPTLEQT